MSKTFKASLFVAAALTSLIGYPGVSQAHGGCDCGSMGAIMATTASTITTAIASSEAAIVSAIAAHATDMSLELRLQSSQLTSAIKTVVPGIERIQSAQTQVLTKNEIQKYGADALLKMTPTKSGCVSGTAVTRLNQYSQSLDQYATATVKTLKNWSLGASGAAEQGRFKAAEASLATHLQKYCGQATRKTGLCDGVATTSPVMEDADITAATLLGPIDTAEMAEAANNFIRRTVAGSPFSPLPKSAYATPEGAIEHERRLNEQAKRSVAQETLAQMLAYRTSGVRSITAEEMRRRILPSDPSKDTASEWHDEMLDAQEARLLREMAYMQAWGLFAQWEGLERQEQTNLLLSTILANTLDNNRAPQNPSLGTGASGTSASGT